MSNLPVTELRSVAKNGSIKEYNKLDKDKLLKDILLSSLSFNELRSISKLRKMKNYGNMSEDELLNAFENSELFKNTKEINKENQDDYEIIRDLKFLYGLKENGYEPRKTKGAFGRYYVEYESNGDIDEVSSIEYNLIKIEPYLTDIINEGKDGWKIQLAAESTFSSVGDEDSKKCYPIYMHSINLKVYDGSVTGIVVDDLLKSFLDNYQFTLRTKMNFIKLHKIKTYKLRKISINRSGGSYIDSPYWIYSKKATINPKNKNDEKCMQYSICITLNINKLTITQKEYQKLNPLLICIIGKT